jgi:SsrA-binding protein
MDIKVVARNKKAFHDYHIIDRFEAGIELLGSEVKSLREGSANIKESFVTIRGGEAFLMGMHIAPYSHTGIEGHDPLRKRRLLLHKREISKLHSGTAEKGHTIVPLSLYFDKNGRAKIEISTVKGKKQYDKRETIKAREVKRDTERELSRKR